MKSYEKKLLNTLRNHVNGFDAPFSRDHADADPIAAAMVGNEAPAAIKGNPRFSATFNLTFMAKYFTLNGGVYTAIAAGALNAGLQNDLPFFIFGHDDFASGFKKIKGLFSLNSNWSYGRPGVWGKDDFNELAFDATVTGTLQTGDLVLPYTSALPGAGTTTLALLIVRCPEVGYGSLLEAIGSDRFLINGVRFVVDVETSATLLQQYKRRLLFVDMSIFGKSQDDSLTPNDYKVPEQFQNGIVDIPVIGKWGGIDKHKIWGFFNLYNNVESSWTVFCQSVDKLSA